MRKQKGFTLIEMVIVIAIIGILTAILVPTWSYFIMKANLRTQNNYSKMIFNAAQTQATRYEVREKKDYSDATSSGATASEKNAAKAKLYLASELNTSTGDFDYLLYWDGKAAHRLTVGGGSGMVGAENDAADTNQNATDAFANSINKILGDANTTAYKVYIKNYQVQSVCSARGDGSDIVGSFPVSQDKRSDDADAPGHDVLSYNMQDIDLIP